MSALLQTVSPNAVRGLGGLLGLAAGLGAGRLADALPRRYDVTLLVEGPARTRRNVTLAILGAAIGLWLGHLLTRLPEVTAPRAAFYLAVNLGLAVAIVAAAAVDLEHMILPNELTLGGALVALATSPWRPVGFVGSLIGIAVGLGITYVPFALYKRLRGRSGMGLGDAKLALFAGAWLGAPGAIYVVFAGAVQSALCALVMRVLGLTFAVPASVQAEIAELRAKAAAGDEEALSALADDPMAADVREPGEHGDSGAEREAGEAFATMRLPMGPFLVLSCLEFLFARREILDLFDRYVAPR
jgi:leader peptidase (prepilin peptidase)/N-methyltransferase